MKILGVDTSTDLCGLAIADDAGILGRHEARIGLTHNEWLLVYIDRLLRDLTLTLSDLDGFAVAIGPGSFTGLRVGLATVQALAVAAGKPLVPVSTLEAMAATVPNGRHSIAPMLDARRGEVYGALFRYEAGTSGLIRELPDGVFAPEAFLAPLPRPVLLVGDGAERYRDLISATLGDDALRAEMGSVAEAVAACGREALRRGEGLDPRRVTPQYHRRFEPKPQRPVLEK
jgi:tRNA threonylcarbamoyladenosine biosynthesis protein TsaB